LLRSGSRRRQLLPLRRWCSGTNVLNWIVRVSVLVFFVR
jgi:hypothetical protein